MKNIKKSVNWNSTCRITYCWCRIWNYSWFTAESHASGTIETGTLSLSQMGSLFDQKQFAPSQVLITEAQTVENKGSLPQVLTAANDS